MQDRQDPVQNALLVLVPPIPGTNRIVISVTLAVHLSQDPTMRVQLVSEMEFHIESWDPPIRHLFHPIS